MHVLIVVLYMGEIEFTKICFDDTMSRIELSDWCSNNWHDEDSSPEDFSIDDMIEWYFDTYEDYSYYRQPIQVLNVDKPADPVQGEDILLTPGMCAIVRNGLAQVTYGKAQELLENHGENGKVGKSSTKYAQNVIGTITNLFE